MSEKKIIVPQGMLKAAVDALWVDWERRNNACRSSAAGMAVEDSCRATYTKALTAALLWLSENPIEPTVEQTDDRARRFINGPNSATFAHWWATEWQRIMFLAPEPEVPEAVKDLLPARGNESHELARVLDNFKESVLEAYRRGVEAGKK